MLKNGKKARTLSLVAALAVAASTLFAVPAAAHDHVEADDAVSCMYVLTLADGSVVYSLSLEAATCGCSNPVYEDYTRDGPHNYMRTDHYTPLVRVCTNCDWEYHFEGIAIGGCGNFCSLPKWPG